MLGHTNTNNKQQQQQQQQKQQQTNKNNNQNKNNKQLTPVHTKQNENISNKQNSKIEILDRSTNILNGKIKIDSSQMKNNNNSATNIKAITNTPHAKDKQFISLKSASNGKNISTQANPVKSPGKSPLINSNNSKDGSRHGARGGHVDINELDDKFLLSNRNINKQDTYARTSSVTRDSWQVHYKECMRHQRLLKDNNLEKTCDSCNILYVLCDTCRLDRNIPFSTSQVCIDCAPAAYTVRGLIEKRDKLIRELHYNTQKVEEDSFKIKKDVDLLNEELAESEHLRETMQEDYRKSVADCLQRESENVELVQNLALRIKEIHALEASIQTNEELAEAMLHLLKTGLYSDCIIHLTLSGDKYPLHKNILASRSPFFRQLLESSPHQQQQQQQQPNSKNQKNTQPQQIPTNLYNLDGIDADTMDQILRFIYCGKCDEIKNDDLALKLYKIADKLSIPSLKELIISYLINRINKSNWIQIAASTQHIQTTSDKFKKYLEDYVLNELKTSSIDLESDNPLWKQIKHANPTFAVEILEKLMKKKNELKKSRRGSKQAEESIIPDDYAPESVGDLSEFNLSIAQQQQQKPLKPMTPLTTRRK